MGKNKFTFIIDGLEEYSKRLDPYCRMEWTIIRESRNPKPEMMIQEETERIIRTIVGKSAACFLVDRQGQSLDSEKFAKLIGYYFDHYSEIQMVIGGAYGVDRSGLTGVNECISFSLMTFNHQIIRLMVTEQIYRAFCILHGKPYHK